ncbi:MAG: hypothetical protein ACK53Y_05530, partial [bacterium]
TITLPSIPLILIGFLVLQISVSIFLFLEISTVDSLSQSIHIRSISIFITLRVTCIVVRVAAVSAGCSLFF